MRLKKILLGLVSLVGALLLGSAWFLELRLLPDWEPVFIEGGGGTSLQRVITDLAYSLPHSLSGQMILGGLGLAFLLAYFLSQFKKSPWQWQWVVVAIVGALVVTGVGFYQLDLPSDAIISSRLGLKLVYKFVGVAGLLGVIFLALSDFKRRWWMRLNQEKKRAVKFAFLALGLEMIVFNFRFYESLFWRPEVLENPVFGKSLHPDSIGNVTYLGSDETTIEYLGINKEIKNIRFDFEPSDGSAAMVGVGLEVTDAGHANYFALPEQVVAPGLAASQYYRLHLVGETAKLRLNLKMFLEMPRFKLVKVVINAPVPFFFSLVRVMVVWGVMILGGVFWPGSRFYKIKLLPWTKKKTLLVLGLVVIQGGLFLQVTRIYSNSLSLFKETGLEGNTQYQLLAQSLLAGKFFLQAAPESLGLMTNPYDHDWREEQGDQFYPTDTVYYQGKYYTYFGMTPVLLLFLPFKLVTGYHLTNPLATWIFSLVFLGSVYGFLYQLGKQKFPQLPLIIYLLLANLLICTANITYLVRDRGIYVVPIAAAAGLSMAGLAFYQRAMTKQTVDKQARVKGEIFWGSLCLALVAGCRPQVLAFGFLGVIYYFGWLLKKWAWLKKENRGTVLVLVGPWLVVGMMMAYYNYARFGSPLEFGAQYNLTITDYTHQGLQIERVGVALWAYFFQPLMLDAVFPFIRSNSHTNYMGFLYREGIYGGFLWVYPWLFLIFLAGKARLILKKMGWWKALWGLVILAFLLGILDVQLMGTTMRYTADFGFILGLAGVLVVLGLYLTVARQKLWRTLLEKFLTVSLILALIYASLLFVAGGVGDGLSNFRYFPASPIFFHRILHLVQFWT